MRGCILVPNGVHGLSHTSVARIRAPVLGAATLGADGFVRSGVRPQEERAEAVAGCSYLDYTFINECVPIRGMGPSPTAGTRRTGLQQAFLSARIP